MIEIKNRFTGEIIYKHESDNLRDVMIAAVKYRANLSGANLYRANLSGADLSGANLSGANLYRANLSGANLSGADLYRANLSEANLSEANLSEADLYRADLYEANLSEANLSEANLSGADLYRANLSGADLYRAKLSGANLLEANLSRSILDPTNKPNSDTKLFEAVSDQEGWVYGYRTRATSAAGLVLQDDRIYGTEVFSTSDDECHPGWYLWPTLELSKGFRDGDHVKVKARVIDIHHAGTKWRSRAIWVIGR